MRQKKSRSMKSRESSSRRRCGSPSTLSSAPARAWSASNALPVITVDRESMFSRVAYIL